MWVKGSKNPPQKIRIIQKKERYKETKAWKKMETDWEKTSYERETARNKVRKEQENPIGLTVCWIFKKIDWMMERDWIMNKWIKLIKNVYYLHVLVKRLLSE